MPEYDVGQSFAVDEDEAQRLTLPKPSKAAPPAPPALTMQRPQAGPSLLGAFLKMTLAVTLFISSLLVMTRPDAPSSRAATKASPLAASAGQAQQASYGQLKDLAEAGLLPPQLIDGEDKGYRFEVHVKTQNGRPVCATIARPVRWGVTGERVFFTNFEGRIFFSTNPSIQIDPFCSGTPEGMMPIR